MACGSACWRGARPDRRANNSLSRSHGVAQAEARKLVRILLASSSAPDVEAIRASCEQVRIFTDTRFGPGSVDVDALVDYFLNTTNIYAEVDLETKARALAACSPEEMPQARWRKQPEVMAFLRSL